MATKQDGKSTPTEPKLAEGRRGVPPAGRAPDLSTEASRIVDRKEDVDAIASILLTGEVRLLTLTGPAGVGKTRLAREVARNVTAHFPHGVVFVDLSPVRDSDLVVPTIGLQLGLHDAGTQSLTDRLRSYLSERKMLLILDNLEQALPADVGLEELLAAAPRLVLLTTSRESLRLLWEQLYHVPPLALPDPDHLPDLEELSQIPSVALFLRRARMSDPRFRLTNQNAKATAELMVRLDGLPLAILLAASRIQLLSPQMLLERLSERLSLLRWEAQDLPERQHTLRTAIAWSYDLLTPPEQMLFGCLGVFVGDFTLEAAEAVAGAVGPEAGDVLEGLGSLVDKSLVQRDDDGQGGYRFNLLESARDFALECLSAAGGLDAAKRSHALYFLALAQRAEPDLTGPAQRAWFFRLEDTNDNLRAALQWLLDNDDGELALCLASALSHFWEIRGYLAEGRRWLEAALARASTANPALRSRALIGLGAVLAMSVDQAGTKGIVEAAHAEEVLTEGMDLARSIGDTVCIARALTFLGTLTLQTGDWDRGRALLQEAQTYFEDAGHDREIIQALLPRGVIAFLQGQDEEAIQLMDEILSRYGDVGDDWGRGVALLFSMSVIARRGDLSRAVAMGKEVLAITVTSHSDRLLYLSAAGTAWLARDYDQPERLARLVSAAESMYQATGLVASVADEIYLATTREHLQACMTREDLDAAKRAAHDLPFEQVATLIAEVLEGAIPAGPHQEAAHQKDDSGITLSARELDVLRLVAEGFSNKQIAHDLIIAESTVRYHLTSIFNKLGVDTRTHAVAVAAQRGLIELGPSG